MHRAISFRRYTRRILLAALFLAFPLAATAVAQSKLPGWGEYIFGMSKSDPVMSKRELLPGTGGADLLDSARIAGQLYAVELYFRGAAAPKLWKIQLLPELGRMNQSDCRSFFEKIAGVLKQNYPPVDVWKGAAGKVPLAQAASSDRKFDDGSTLRISEIFTGGCKVNITYEAPPLPPIEGSGF